MRIRLLLAYDGGGFHGWQIQEKPDPPPTAQGAVEAALFALSGRKTRIYGAGRTDAGVHAHGQTAHFDWPDGRPFASGRIQKALNALLPAAIRVLDVCEVPESFHARKSAVSKTYVYQLWRHARYAPPALAPYVWQCGPLDMDRMERIIPHLLGRHDFASFQNAGTPVRSTVRTMFEIRLEEAPPDPFYPACAPMLRIFFVADGFLKQMARNLAGLLVYSGKGKIEPESAPLILERGDRRFLPAPTAPARGLALARVDYPAQSPA